MPAKSVAIRFWTESLCKARAALRLRRQTAVVRGLDPRTHEICAGHDLRRRHNCSVAEATGDCDSWVTMKGGWVYIMTNRPNGTLYVGVTSDLVRRVWEHREGVIDGHTKRYGLKRLVYAEHHDEIQLAIQREKTIKLWPRAWKVVLILKTNPDWNDLFETIL